MMSVSTSEESERRLAEAMRAQASGLGRPGFVGRNPGTLGPNAAGPTGPVGSPAVVRRAPAPSGWADAAGLDAESPGLWAALVSTRYPLLLALLGGVVLGVALALLSLLAPGVLPTLG
jgi:hypothetical protein